MAVSAILLSTLDSCRVNRKGNIEFPSFLAGIVEEKLIREIGAGYCNSFSNEKDKDLLQRILLDGYSDEKADENSIMLFLQEKVNRDFMEEGDKVVVINGWVLSRTEARQCALYFLIHS
jgi:hypothetical protein